MAEEYLTTEEILARFKQQVSTPINLKKFEEYASAASGSATLCKMPAVLNDYADFVGLARLTGEGLEHLNMPSDRAVQQLIDSFTKHIAEILVDDCGCAPKTERDRLYYERASGEFGDIEEMRT